MKMRDYDKKEKMYLYDQIQKQKMMYKLKEMKYQSQLLQYQAFSGLPIWNLIGNNNNMNNPYSLGLSIDELIKIFLFKEMLNSSRINNEYENYLLKTPFNYRNNSLLSSYNRYIYDKYKKLKRKNRSYISDEPYKGTFNGDDYTTHGKKIPFINSGKFYSKIKDNNKNNKIRFNTSHNKKDTKYTKDEKKEKEEKKEYKKSKKSSTPENSKSESNGGSKANSDDESEDKKEEEKSTKKDDKNTKKTESGEESGENDDNNEEKESSENNDESNNEEKEEN